MFFDVILKHSEALVCFRASGDNYLRSITRAIVNKNVGKRNMVFDVILRLSEALVRFRASGDNFLRFITRAIINKNNGKKKRPCWQISSTLSGGQRRTQGSIIEGECEPLRL